MPVFWDTNPPEMSASACLVLSHLILIKGRYLPDLLDFLRDFVEIKRFFETLFDTPLR